MLRKLTMLMTTVALIFGGALATASPASAVTCYGDYCSGKQPDQTGCAAGAVTVDAVDFRGGRLELRWSPTCKTNWARLQVYPGGFAYTLAAVQDTGYTQSVQWAGRCRAGHVLDADHLLAGEISAGQGDRDLLRDLRLRNERPGQQRATADPTSFSLTGLTALPGPLRPGT